MDDFDKLPIEPIYKQTVPNEIIEFGAVEATVLEKTTNTPRKITGHARLRFSPSTSLEFAFPEETNRGLALSILASSDHFGQETVSVNLKESTASFDAFCLSSSSDRSIYLSERSAVQVRDPCASIIRGVFHLLNWPDFNGPNDYVLKVGEPPIQGAMRCGRFRLKVDGWTVTVTGTPETKPSLKMLHEVGGYIITHVGSIERDDGKRFSSDDLDGLLARLSYFFSWTFGRWAGPSFTVGFDESGDRVYEQWGIGRSAEDRWNGLSWFDEHHAELFEEVHPGFWRLWSSSIWRRAMSEAIYWYVSANQTGKGVGVDSGLLFTQAALELLSWTYCVLDRKMVSASAFKPRGLGAADKLRLLVRSLDIPLEIPICLTALRSTPGKKWDDSMDAITALRNGLVHPGRNMCVPDGAYYDAWRLSLWYIDLILLRLCSHTGRYANRLVKRYVGQVEPVPWAHE